MLLYERTKCEALHQEILFSGFVIYNPALFYKKMMRLLTKATRMTSDMGIWCLSSLRPRCVFCQRQPDRPPTGISAAFQVWDQDAFLVKGNQMGLQPGNLLPFKSGCKMGFWAEATGLTSNQGICCLSSLSARWDFGQRQLDRPPTGESAAFQVWDQDAILVKGNQIGLHPAYLLPLAHSSKIGFSAKATGLASNRHICCLCSFWASLVLQQRQPKWLPTGISAAFGHFEQVWAFFRGNQIGLRQTKLLPLTFWAR